MIPFIPVYFNLSDSALVGKDASDDRNLYWIIFEPNTEYKGSLAGQKAVLARIDLLF